MAEDKNKYILTEKISKKQDKIIDKNNVGISITEIINTTYDYNFNFEGKKYKREEIVYADFSKNEELFNTGKRIVISTAISEEEARRILEKIANQETLKPEERRHVYTIEEFYTAHRTNFIERSKETANFYFEFRYLKQIIKLYNPSNKLMLDAGCGVGRLTIPLLELGTNIVGIDITPILIEDAKNQNRTFADRFQIVNLISLPFSDKTFKIIFMMWHVISDLNGSEGKKDTIEKAISEISRCIENGGIFVFDVPDKTSDSIKKHYVGDGEDKNFREFLAKIPQLEYLDELLQKN